MEQDIILGISNYNKQVKKDCKRRGSLGFDLEGKMSKKVLILSIVMLLIGALTVTGSAQQVISIEYGELWKDLFEPAVEEFEKITGDRKSVV